MADQFHPRFVPNMEHETRFKTAGLILLWIKDHWPIILIVLLILGGIAFTLWWFRTSIQYFFESLAGPWLRDAKNDWIYLILLFVLLLVYRKFPKFFAPLTVIFVAGMLVLLCFQAENFDTANVVNKWGILALFVLPVLPIILLILLTSNRWYHIASIVLYVALAALMVIINPMDFIGKYTKDQANVYVIGLVGLFALLCVFLNKNFEKDLWSNYITKLGFILICLVTTGFTFQYAVRFFIEKPSFSGNYILMLAIIIGNILLFLSVGIPYVLPLLPQWVRFNLFFHVIYCFIRDFFLQNKAMTFYILLVEIALIVWYVVSQSLYTKFEEGDKGKQLFNLPLTLARQTVQKVPFDINANYAISFWLYLVPQSKEQSATSSIFVNVLDYSHKPSVTYNAALNTLRVTVRLPYNKKNAPAIAPTVYSTLTTAYQDEYDAETRAGSSPEKANAAAKRFKENYDNAYHAAIDAGKSTADAEKQASKTAKAMMYDNLGEEVLMADITKIPLQRWHHIVLAYNNGTFDIFLNGVLYRSIPGVITDLQGSNLLIGEQRGNAGKICNLVFYQGGASPTKTFTHNLIAISGDKVTALYNNFASKNPPVVSRVLNIATEPSYAQMRVNHKVV